MAGGYAWKYFRFCKLYLSEIISSSFEGSISSIYFSNLRLQLNLDFFEAKYYLTFYNYLFLPLIKIESCMSFLILYISSLLFK